MKKLKLIFLLAYIFVAFTGQATNCFDPDATTQSNLCNPANSIAGDLPSLVIKLVQVLGYMIGWTVIAYVMFSGFRMIMSQGNEEEVSKAKSSFQWALSGFVVALFAYILIYATSVFIGTSDINLNDPGVCQLNPLTSGSFGSLLAKMMRNLLSLAGLVAIFLIVLSGFKYVTARGNEEQLSQAQKGLQWAVIGLVVILLSYVLVVATAKLFGADVTTDSATVAPDQCDQTRIYPLNNINYII